MLHVFTPYGRAGASARVRVFQWLEHLGTEHRLADYVGTPSLPPRAIATHPFTAARREIAFRQPLRSATTVLVHRCATPLSRGGVEVALLNQGHPGIYDFDDALQWQSADGGLPSRWFPRADAAVAAVKAAGRIIAGNAVLAEWAAGHNRDIRVIPSCVEPSCYVRKHSYELGDPPVLGWVGSKSTERYLEAIAPALAEVHRRTGARIVIVSARNAAPGPLDAIATRVTWSERFTHNHVADWDIGIMPLADGLYERGKCGYKLVEYGAAGLPVVASPVGINSELVAGMGGLAATSQDEWVDALTAVLDASAERRTAMGDQGRRLIETSYSYAIWCDRWREAIAA